jgi:hypothetical protein
MRNEGRDVVLHIPEVLPLITGQDAVYTDNCKKIQLDIFHISST